MTSAISSSTLSSDSSASLMSGNDTPADSPFQVVILNSSYVRQDHIRVVVIFEVIDVDRFIGNDSDCQRFSRYLILDFSALFWKNTLGVPRAYLRAKNARREICTGLNGRLGSRAEH